jgi:hypothetical protein
MADEHDILIIWDQNIEDDFDHYLIRRSSDYVTYSVVGKTKQPHFTDKKLPISPSYIILEAVAGGEGSGHFDLTGDVTALIPADSYIIIRNSSGNDGFYQVKTISFVSGVTRVWPYGGVTDGTDDGTIYQPYYYTISAVDKEGNESSPSSPIIKTSPTDVIAPATPTGFTARRLEDYSGVQLFWQENTETDLKGYVLYRTFDGVTYHVASILSANTYKDDDIPRSEDTLFDATYVAYAVAAYDKSGNIGVSTSVLGFFTIPTIRGIRVSIDFLSLNVSWTEPLLEDGIGGVAVWYRKKVDTLWTYVETVDWPTSRVYIDGPLDQDTEYDVAVGTYISSTYGIITVHQGLKYFEISGVHAAEFPVGAILEITGSTGNDGQYTVTASENLAGPDRTRLTVLEAIPSGTVDGNTFCFTLQVPIKRVIIPDYDTDVTPPTDPWGLYGRADPQNERIFLSWSRVLIDDDFLRFEILTLESGGQYILHGTSRDNNYTLNDANFHVRPDNLVYVKVRAVDRSENISGASSFAIAYYSFDLASSVEFLPQWITYTEDYFSSFQHASMRKYSLTWNDAAEKALFFRRHVLFSTIQAFTPSYAITNVNQSSKYFDILGHHATELPTGTILEVAGSTENNGPYTITNVQDITGPDRTRITVLEAIPSSIAAGVLFSSRSNRFNLDGNDVLAITTPNQFTYSEFQDEDKPIGSATASADLFVISGNWASLYLPGNLIVVSGSTGNDGVWTIDKVNYVAGTDSTWIYVVEDVTSDVGDGQIDAYAIFIWAGVEDWFGAVYIGPSTGILAIIKT